MLPGTFITSSELRACLLLKQRQSSKRSREQLRQGEPSDMPPSHPSLDYFPRGPSALSYQTRDLYDTRSAVAFFEPSASDFLDSRLKNQTVPTLLPSQSQRGDTEGGEEGWRFGRG
ncbi:hypothetical protein LshimejAT787_0503380 [Lyophyllum shimeji]|uniref:Uncharacterized protein n=1 Tax=Lyophyllum shimeji TaxID=47721 RepID=A0A9P3PM67_LYOSH|nr:hypothetical protein LshimejAT787_0503380 [Lyophyllum shimeji]